VKHVVIFGTGSALVALAASAFAAPPASPSAPAKKPAAAASTSVTPVASTVSTAPATATSSPEDTTKAAKVDATKAVASGSTNPDEESTEAAPAVPKARPAIIARDLFESPDTWYYSVGARYRANPIPKFWVNLFVDQGASMFSNSVGIEAEFRKGGFSIIPAITYTEFGTDDILFLQKGTNEKTAGNWSVFNSSIKVIGLQLDLLWSKRFHKMFEFEYGLGVSLGMTFDSLGLNWVYADPKGKYKGENNRSFSLCQAGDESKSGRVGCGPQDHSLSPVIRNGGYQEPSWFNGGSKPSLLANIYLPTLGLRFKPHRNFAARLSAGFSITSFWLGISGSYEFARAKAAPKATDSIEVEETVE
jgi:hypothetical protein